MKSLVSAIAAGLLLAWGIAMAPADERPEAVTESGWQEAVISVSDIDVTARFFVDIEQESPHRRETQWLKELAH